jgi:hypothetical protein
MKPYNFGLPTSYSQTQSRPGSIRHCLSGVLVVLGRVLWLGACLMLIITFLNLISRSSI